VAKNKIRSHNIKVRAHERKNPWPQNIVGTNSISLEHILLKGYNLFFMGANLIL
jgi:hypothetical protein